MKKLLAITAIILSSMVLSASAEEANVDILSTQYVQGKRVIRVQHGSYNGIEYIDLREVYQDEEGNEKYTKKGFAIKPEQTRELIKALQRV